MKNQALLFSLICILFTACEVTPVENKQVPQTPKALDNNNNDSYEMVSKRSYEDLVESLYAEQVEKSPELKALENKIASLPKIKTDSTETFNNYHGKNQSYYSTAAGHVQQIGDSVLREKMKKLIVSSLTRYNSTVSRHSELLKSIDTRMLTLKDLHTVLKITKTMAIMEKYQADNLPSLKPIQGFSKELDKTIQTTDGYSKK